MFEHFQFCARKVRRTSFKYPWQIGFMSDSRAGASLLDCNLGPIGMQPLSMDCGLMFMKAVLRTKSNGAVELG